MAKKKPAKAASSSDRNRWVLIGAGALLVVVAAVAVYVFAFSGGGDSNANNLNKPKPTPVVFDSQSANVDVVDNKFTPPIIQIKRGTTVTWNFKGNVSHTVTSVSGTGPIQPTAAAGAPTVAPFHFDSGGRTKGKTYDFTFDTPGRYNYFCTIHHIMEGTIIVTDESGQIPSPTAAAAAKPTSTP